jgi:hypothetical protein
LIFERPAVVGGGVAHDAFEGVDRAEAYIDLFRTGLAKLFNGLGVPVGDLSLRGEALLCTVRLLLVTVRRVGDVQANGQDDHGQDAPDRQQPLPGSGLEINGRPLGKFEPGSAGSAAMQITRGHGGGVSGGPPPGGPDGRQTKQNAGYGQRRVDHESGACLPFDSTAAIAVNRWPPGDTILTSTMVQRMYGLYYDRPHGFRERGVTFKDLWH